MPVALLYVNMMMIVVLLYIDRVFNGTSALFGLLVHGVCNCTVIHWQGDGSCGESKMNTQRLIAKIIQLQTTNISLTNKLEFIQEHTRQLTEELKSKSRLVPCIRCFIILVCD